MSVIYKNITISNSINHTINVNINKWSKCGIELKCYKFYNFKVNIRNFDADNRLICSHFDFDN